MNALVKLQALSIEPLKKPKYIRWDLVRQNDPQAWVRENAVLLRAWWNDLNTWAGEEPEDSFDVFCLCQFDIERSFFEELREDAKLDHDYIDREDI